MIMGGNDVDLGVRQGGRFTLGRWFDPQQTVGFEGNYFFLGSASDSQSAIALGGPAASTLMLPFFDVTGALTGGTPGQGAVAGSGPHLQCSRRTERSVHHARQPLRSKRIAGGLRLRCVQRDQVGTLPVRYAVWLPLVEPRRKAGFHDHQRNGQLGPGTRRVQRERLVRDEQQLLRWAARAASRIRSRRRFGRLARRILLSRPFLLGLGDTAERININGASQTNIGTHTTVVNYAGGVFAQPSNMGNYDANHFAVVPEGDLAWVMPSALGPA